jgi:ketopantoate reductase
VGTGAIGLFLTKILKDNQHDVSNYDSRKTLMSTEFKLIINDVKSSLDIKPSKCIGHSEDLIIVTTKSFNIDQKLISLLISCKKDVLFLQNGIVTMSTLDSISNKFNFGTLTGIQAFLSDNQLTVITNGCKVLIKDTTMAKSIENLQRFINPLCSFTASENIDDLIFTKFIRWLVVSVITSLTSQNLGDALSLIPRQEIEGGIEEILQLINQKFHLKIKVTDIYNSIIDLPKELRTSSFRNYTENKENEMILELNYVLKSLKERSLKPKILIRWSKDLSNKN